ncbi:MULTISPECIES: Cof-type HAD-IIB family hydrolase [Clostridium]|uniref:Cof-type HAD-IIB family hydrolase n=1 Tax=Clostridium TaxID=1485 RepID=UPI000824971B|nr:MULTISPECIES: Cof-type HAD-IIB family hydrolase [Clostridium]PJI10454.1 Cof-type HAD-IIB family hydrolase [Clostridium sp. CT7]
MSKIKVIIMDIDGTLTNDKKVITKKTKDTLIKAQEKGIILVLASGRPTSGLMDYARELEMNKNHGLLVSFNGSKVTDCETNKVLFNEAMSIKQGQAVLEHMKKFDVKPMVVKDDYMYVNDAFDNEIDYKGEPFNIIKYEARNCKFKVCEKDDLAEFADYPLNKILTAGNPEYLQAHYKEMFEPFKDTLSGMFTADFYFEFTAQGIDKAKALDTALIPMGYKKEEMIAFGDGQNDASMVKYVGTGVAMANAVDELKDVADEITLSNEEDGIAHTLNKYITDL